MTRSTLMVNGTSAFALGLALQREWLERDPESFLRRDWSAECVRMAEQARKRKAREAAVAAQKAQRSALTPEQKRERQRDRQRRCMAALRAKRRAGA